MSGDDYRESLRRYRPKVYVNGHEVRSVADEPQLAAGVNATGARLSELLEGRSDIPYEKRLEAARLIEDLTASNQGGWYSVISLHGGGSPEAMKMEIWRNYPLGSKVDLVERLLERGVLADATRRILKNRQPGRCCIGGVCRALARACGAAGTQKERLT